MGERTEHPEEPAEGSEHPERSVDDAFDSPPDEDADSDPDPGSGPASGPVDDMAAAMPGRLNQDPDDPSRSDPGLSPDEPVGSA